MNRRAFLRLGVLAPPAAVVAGPTLLESITGWLASLGQPRLIGRMTFGTVWDARAEAKACLKAWLTEAIDKEIFDRSISGVNPILMGRRDSRGRTPARLNDEARVAARAAPAVPACCT